jgi:hypothetical protein
MLRLCILRVQGQATREDLHMLVDGGDDTISFSIKAANIC